MTPSSDPAATYLNQLLSITYLGRPLVEVPNGIAVSIGLCAALVDLEVALLKVQIAVLKEQLPR